MKQPTVRLQRNPHIQEAQPITTKKRVGRPTKKEISAKSSGGRGQVGRPKGDAGIINEYKARMLASPKSQYVLDKIYEVALEDEHKHQAACMKMIIDRIAPLSYFEKDGQNKGVGGITITVNAAQPEVHVGETIDHAE